ncbi:hypothetical protein SteCoe_15506 [Stentor coeruleus]|uniref:Acyltransferase 3 domain-containing protein n=1 Tax=Stentor coeruleus TaxID=5963 RepID=A0A1R2C3I8_9CILI|nr:hypothetical protein SteCoe_15506 [Stentor coeruleus]
MLLCLSILSILLTISQAEVETCKKDLSFLVTNKTEDFGRLIYYSGRDFNDLGQYLECLDLNYSRYVVITCQVMKINAALGICGPKSCEAEDYMSGLLYILSHYPIGEKMINPTTIKVKEPYKEDNAPITSMAIIVLILLSILILAIITGTIVGKNAQANPEKRLQGWRALIISFSITNNFNKLISFPEQYDHLHLFNGLRVLLMVFISYAHNYMYNMNSPMINPLMTYDMVTSFWHYFIYYGMYSVDFFFVMAGFFMAYTTLAAINQSKGKISCLKLVIHRFIRICPVYYGIYLFFLALFPYFGSGPAWQVMKNKSEYVCMNYWWSVFLFTNNLIPKDRYGCMGWTWFLSCDMQFYICSCIILLLYCKNRILGYSILCILLIVNIIITVVLSAENNYNPGVRYGFLDSYQFVHSFIRPYFRMNAYIIGLMLGIVYRKYKDSLSALTERKDIEMEGNESVLLVGPQKKLQKNSSFEQIMITWVRIKTFRLVSYVFGFLLITYVIFAPYEFSKNGPDYWSEGQKLLFLAVEHIFVCCGFVLIILPMIEGYGGVVLGFLTHKYFAVLARISFSYYMIHPMVLLFFINNNYQSAYLQDMHINYSWVTAVVITLALSVISTLALESPMKSLTKLPQDVYLI